MNKSAFNKHIRSTINQYMIANYEDPKIKLKPDEDHAKMIIDIFLDGLTSAITEHDEVAILSYFRIYKQHRKAREGRNPKTGEAIVVPAYTNVAFKAGAKLKEAVNPAKE